MAPYRFYNSPTVKVTAGAGDAAKLFYVHEEVLAAHSEYFQRLLRSQWPEGKAKDCSRASTRPAVFDLFVQWLYNGKYSVTAALPAAEGGAEHEYYRMHAEAYVLGNEIIAPVFKRYVVATLCAVLAEYRADFSMAWLLDVAAIVYEGTSDRDGREMRALLAHYTSSRIGQVPWPGSAGKMVEKKKHFTREDAEELARSGQVEFIRDVFMLVFAGPQIAAADILGKLYPERRSGGGAGGGGGII